MRGFTGRGVLRAIIHVVNGVKSRSLQGAAFFVLCFPLEMSGASGYECVLVIGEIV